MTESLFKQFEQETIFISTSRDMDGVAWALSAKLADLSTRLNEHFRPYYYVETERETLWNHSKTWQSQIPRPADPMVRLTISIFSERVGTPLPKEFRPPAELGLEKETRIWFSPEGRMPPEGCVALTGTVFEWLDSVYACSKPASPGRRGHLTFFVGPKTIGSPTLTPHDRAWGGRRYKTGEESGAYKEQIEQLTLFHDWVTRERGLPAERIDPHDDDVIASDIFDFVRKYLTKDIPKWTQLKGLEAYEIEDGRHFYGREEWTKNCVQTIVEADRNGTPVAFLLTGVSGMGKSSCLKAGILHALKEKRGNRGEAREMFFSVLSVPAMTAEGAGDPLDWLFGKIIESGVPLALPADEMRNLIDGCKTPAEKTEIFCRKLREALNAERTRLLVAIDQLEEAIDLAGADGRLPARWRQILDLLLAAAEEKLVWLLGTLSDERRERFAAMPETVFGRFRTIEVENPAKDALSRLIGRSLGSVGLEAEEPLLARLTSEVKSIHDQKSPVLPLLSMMLTRLVELHGERSKPKPGMIGLKGAEKVDPVLRLQDFEHADLSVAGTIDRAAEKAWIEAAKSGLDPALGFQRLMAGLVRMTLEEEDYRLELVTGAKAGSKALSGAVNLARHLRERRILTGSPGGGYRIAHMAVLEHWARADRFLVDWSETLKAESDFNADARTWSARGKPGNLLLSSDEELEKAMRLLSLKDYASQSTFLIFIKASLTDRPDIAIAVDDERKYPPLVYAAYLGDVDLLEALLETGAAIGSATKAGNNALHIAAAYGRLEAVKWLLSRVSVNTTNNDQVTPLHFAAQEGHTEVAERLLREDSIDVNKRTDQQATPLHLAAQNGHAEVAERLFRADGIDVNARIDRQFTPLHLAAQNGHTEVAERLLRADGIDVNARTIDQVTPLHVAAQEGHTEVAERLLRADGIDVNAQADRQFTPLHLAAQNGHAEVAERLLREDGIDVNARTVGQFTPLHLAAQNGHAEVAERLLRADGIDVNAREVDQFTPLHLAAQNGHAEVAERLLREGGIDVNARTSQQFTPLHLAAQNGHAEVAERLLRADGIDVNAREVDQWTPLHLAAQNGRAEVAERLLRADGIDVNAQDDRRAAPLYIAVVNNHFDCVKRLVESRANLETRTENGDTPLFEAIVNKHIETALFLVSAGADVHASCRFDGSPVTPINQAIANGDRDFLAKLLASLPQPQVPLATRKLNDYMFDAIASGQRAVARVFIAHKAATNGFSVDEKRHAIRLASDRNMLDLERELSTIRPHDGGIVNTLRRLLPEWRSKKRKPRR